MDVRFLSAGDTALVVEFGDRIERGLSEAVLRLASRIRAAAVAGVVASDSGQWCWMSAKRSWTTTIFS